MFSLKLATLPLKLLFLFQGYQPNISHWFLRFRKFSIWSKDLFFCRVQFFSSLVNLVVRLPDLKTLHYSVFSSYYELSHSCLDQGLKYWFLQFNLLCPCLRWRVYYIGFLNVTLDHELLLPVELFSVKFLLLRIYRTFLTPHQCWSGSCRI